MQNSDLKIFCCGGTIDKVYFDANSEFQVGEPQIVTVLRDANITFEYEVESILRKDSLDMTAQDRDTVRLSIESCDNSHILITHGTDSMIATARALKGIKNKTVVLTGAMEPAKLKETDACFNIGCAIVAVQTLPAGIYIAMNGRIFTPDRVRKNLAENRFEEISPEQ